MKKITVPIGMASLLASMTDAEARGGGHSRHPSLLGVGFVVALILYLIWNGGKK